MSRFLNVLRSWLVMVSVIAAGNTLQSFRDHGFLSEKLYTASPGLGKGRASRPGAWRPPSSREPWTVLGVPPLGPGSCPLPRRAPPRRDGGWQAGPCVVSMCSLLLYAVNGLQARTFGVWTLLSSVIRCLCAIDIRNRTLYHITLFTFFLALAHFLSEVFVYHTAALTIGVMAPLMVASFSILGMLIGLQYLEVEALSQNKKKN
uniref:Ergosterol biosynthesis 28 homolog n=2 Tax=Passeriformes TaxID=9126 RepID=A0A8C5NPZ5_JUNHY